ncbi:uncharacterized protein LOC123513646 [Portunus trituberculatus]|uniref:uncharacterized protein LOC123513646 n=1 Tax=Portunus trituberculatus TaxID=210409 RepID=UPI001E1CE25E|nr:uncharacterized protein LOC123513646 [Portunus trituberculatus]
MEPGMDLTTGARPRLLQGPPAGDAVDSVSHPSLLHQPSPFLDRVQPFPATAMGAEEEDDVSYGFRKVKMFEMAPSDDPEMEERRQRALYAKRNREMKKREVVQLQKEKEELKASLQEYEAKMTSFVQLSHSQQRRIEEIQQHLSDTLEQLRDKEECLRKINERMSLLKAHLELIAEGLEESMSRKMLVNLLAHFDQNHHYV